ncbi:phosphotransferase KptA/Tpt1 [Gorgonomyces haynaldii]|nr:phosphotransferase KptA/Tpt1 [Gorgonomyces haynaldii]
MEDNGFVRVSDLLQHKKLKGYTFQDIQDTVQLDQKQRYLLQDSNGWRIRANQGHSIKVEMEFKRLLDLKECVHGTFLDCLESIKASGLKTMSRQYIHFALSPDEASGIRRNCQVLIYIDTQRAMEDGIEFYLSDNNVVLSKGINGILSSQYFSKITDRQGNKL